MNIEDEIKKEYKKLDKYLGIDTSHIKILFTNDQKSENAAFCEVDKITSEVLSITFNLFLFGNLKKADQIDVMRHEYAHAAAYIKYGYKGNHGEKWQRMCRKIGCRPLERIYSINVPEVLYSSANKVSEDISQVRCAKCGNITMQEEYSHIVKALRNGYLGLNYRCENCGSVVFILEEEKI